MHAYCAMHMEVERLCSRLLSFPLKRKLRSSGLVGTLTHRAVSAAPKERLLRFPQLSNLPHQSLLRHAYQPETKPW